MARAGALEIEGHRYREIVVNELKKGTFRTRGDVDLLNAQIDARNFAIEPLSCIGSCAYFCTIWSSVTSTRSRKMFEMTVETASQIRAARGCFSW